MLTPARTFAIALACLLLAVACGGGGEAETEPTAPGVIVGGPSGPAATTAAPTGSSTEPSITDEPTDAPTPEPRLVSLDWLTGSVAVPGLEGGIAAPHIDNGLQNAVQGALAGFGGEASFVVHNLTDGRYAASGESRTWYAASTYKAAVLLEAYRQRDAGTLDFEEKLKVTEEYTQYDQGTLEYLEIKEDDEITVRDAVAGMIVVSDTPLAVLMSETVGYENIDGTLRSIGATTMEVGNTELPTSAIDLAQLMIAIVSGQGVSGASRDEMLSLMAQEWFAEGIIAGLPGGTSYAHKSGSLGANVHDAGIVWGPGGPYVIVVMTDGSEGWTPIASASAAVYNYFAANP